MNYEPVVGGYARVDGFERFDGRKASEAQVYKLPFITGTVAPTIGSTITGATSGATAVLLEVENLTGTYAGGNAAGTLVVCEVVGGFNIGEVLRTGATAFAHSNDITTEVTDVSDPAYANKGTAEFRRRPLVQKVPGSGPVRGGFVFNGVAYAVRDNVGATQGVIYKSSGAGWVAQSFGRRLFFDLGLVEVLEGQTLVGATSGASATVERIIVASGEWGAALDADKAQGRFILSNQVGVFQLNEILKVGATNVATNIDGNSIQLTLPPGGRYVFKVKNFYGATNRQRIYGVNGVGTGFEYDGGSVLVPILTGTPTDTPTRVFDIGNALGLCFPGGSIQISEPGSPCVFNAILGALEIGLGDDITDVIDSTDDAVIFFAKEKIASLTGRSVDDFVLSEITEEAGADAWTVQRIGQISSPLTAQSYGQTLYLDRRGLRNLAAASTSGDFTTGAVSELFASYLTAKRAAGAVPAGSLRSKSKTHYRLYYSDGSGFTVYMGGKAPEMLPFQLKGLTVYALFSGELADGTEGLFACSAAADGFLYQLDSGSDFDGNFLTYFVMTPFNHLGSIGMNKRFASVAIEGSFPQSASVGVIAQFDYGDGEEVLADVTSLLKAGGAEFARVDDTRLGGSSVAWDPTEWQLYSFEPGFGFEGMVEADIAGTGRNVSLVIGGSSASPTPAHTLESYTIRWVPRGQVKRTAA